MCLMYMYIPVICNTYQYTCVNSLAMLVVFYSTILIAITTSYVAFSLPCRSITNQLFHHKFKYCDTISYISVADVPMTC